MLIDVDSNCINLSFLFLNEFWTRSKTLLRQELFTQTKFERADSSLVKPREFDFHVGDFFILL